jgi:hypothetical protein
VVRHVVTGRSGHVFAQQRPSHGGDYTLHGQQIRVVTFRDLPAPTGPPPYRLDLKDVLAPAAYRKIVRTKRMSFHLNGDIGGIGNSTPQQLVAAGMEADLTKPSTDGQTPAFLYLTGDCVYYNGQVADYYAQYYSPYEYYGAPIFAVAGNHDGENVEGEVSLDGFVRNFCAPTPVKQPESGDSHRTAMVQPNVYWTLLTPLINIIGLYSNVPEGGEIRPPQTDWLANELAALPADQPILLALHHPIYSPFTAGHWVPGLVTATGGVPVSGRAGRRSVATSWDALAAEAPDEVLVAPCAPPAALTCAYPPTSHGPPPGWTYLPQPSQHQPPDHPGQPVTTRNHVEKPGPPATRPRPRTAQRPRRSTRPEPTLARWIRAKRHARR